MEIVFMFVVDRYDIVVGYSCICWRLIEEKNYVFIFIEINIFNKLLSKKILNFFFLLIFSFLPTVFHI